MFCLLCHRSLSLSNNFRRQTLVMPTAPLRLRIITAGLLAAFLSALDTTVLSTVMPTIAVELGGLNLYSWVFAIYMVMTAVSLPIWGKLADARRKEGLLTTAILVFLSGSVLCGLSRSMTLLILFRGIQGIGAGGLASVPFTMISLYYPSHERGKALGILSSAWGISSVVGPALGSAIVSALSWPWVFFLNLPLGIAAIALVAASHAELPLGKKQPIDFGGALLMAGLILSLLLTAQSVSQAQRTWGVAVQGTVAVSFLVAFLAQERHAKNPILPLHYFAQRSFWLGNLLGFLASFAMYAIIAFLPLYAQSVLGGTAVQSGLVVAPMSLAWSLSSIMAGRQVSRLGENALIRGGMMCLVVGLILLLPTHQDTSLWYLILCAVIAGTGMGCLTPPLLLSVQHSLSVGEVGVATSTQMLARTIGGAIGVSVLGAVLTGSIATDLTEGLARGAIPELPREFAHLLLDPQKLLAPDVRSQLSHEQLTFILSGFMHGLHRTFLGGLLVVACAFVASRFLPASALHIRPHGSPTLLGDRRR
jgi:EmrB/QacA subfamily drug resistance transporter